MPAFGINKNVMCYIDDIYIYLRARSANEAIGRGRPAKKAAKPASFSRRPRRHAWPTDGTASARPGHACQGERFPARLADRLALPAAAQQTGLAGRLELVDPKVLRVCADPNNLPFSNEKEEGFENRLADFVAGKLGKSVAYTYFPMVTGFVRNTLGAHKCDVIIGYPQGDELVQNTNPYYRTAYTLIYKPNHGLDGLETLADPRLQDEARSASWRERRRRPTWPSTGCWRRPSPIRS